MRDYIRVSKGICSNALVNAFQLIFQETTRLLPVLARDQPLRIISTFYDFGSKQIIGASPESLVSVKDRVVTTNLLLARVQEGSMKRLIGNW